MNWIVPLLMATLSWPRQLNGRDVVARADASGAVTAAAAAAAANQVTKMPRVASWVPMSQTVFDELPSSASSTLEDVRCYNFSVGSSHRMEFYSPGYPATYPARVDCFLVLTADAGFVIRVDFRDQFDVEPHDDCQYDFLEVRDGGHGYSELVGRYCGRSFPPVITSSSRQLWLRFSSDDNIEYTGFRAVYQFIPDPEPSRPEGSCRFEMSGLDGVFGRSDIADETINLSTMYQVPLDCTWVITVAEHQKIQLIFTNYALVSPNECQLNYIEIFGEKTDLRHRIKKFCGSKIDVVLSKTNVIHLRLYADPAAVRSTFEALFTAVTLYRETEANPKCVPSEFDCEDAVCIDQSLRCNGRINCKFRYDEENCKVITKKIMSKDHIIVILTIFCVTLFGLCFSCVFRCFRKLKADHNVYQARRSRSREDRLDVFDDASSKCKEKARRGKADSRPTGSQAAASRSDDPEDVFHHAGSSRSQSIPNGLPLDSYAGAEPRPSAAVVVNEARFPVRVAAFADSSARDSDEDPGDGDDEDDDEDDDDVEEVEMVDHACQTRESLFDQHAPPPPLAAPVPSVAATPNAPPASENSRYKAERTIEILRSPAPVSNTRARLVKANTSSSVASSKSGPDIVILH